MSSTKLDFSVGSFDFRLQMEADNHGATKHTQQTTRAKNSSTHRSHSRHTAFTQRAAHRQRAQRATALTQGAAHRQRAKWPIVCTCVFDRHTQQATRAKTAAHTAHTAGTHRLHSGQHTDNERSGRDNGQRRAGMESVCPLGVCPLSVSTAVLW